MGNWNDLLIRGYGDSVFSEGYTAYHVRMGKGFIDAIETSPQMKEPVQNDSRKEHGVRMIVSRKKASRTVTLQFNIFGSTREQYMANKRAFEELLCRGIVDIKVNDDSHPDIYRLVYTGKSVTYKHSYNGQFGILTLQFTEPNPDNRDGTENPYVRVI